MYMYRGSAKKYPLKNFANFSRTIERYVIKFYSLVTHSVIRKCEKFHYIIFRIDKILSHDIFFSSWYVVKSASKQSKFIRQNNIMTILIQYVNNTMAGYQKEILPSSWSPIVKYSMYNTDKWSERSVRSKHKECLIQAGTTICGCCCVKHR